MTSLRVKLEIQSPRVKGLSFHPTRPWILTSLHSGVIHLYDYRSNTLLEVYEGHDGPVRGIHFNQMQSLFVSGGDDGLVKVWDYRKGKCLFTLQGHMDYVRSVEFHHTLPWINSASDDQTVRLWNWQSRACMAIITGHMHYVMCARFHPGEENLLASISLDSTLRIWDFSRLREKNSHYTSQKVNPNEFVIGLDVMVKEVMQNHSKGVNWVAFNKTGQLLATASDDKSVKVWKLTDQKMWEMDSLRGHSHNVTCVIFHPNMEIIISCSEDKHMIVWDSARRVSIENYKRETDRLWNFDVHSTQSYLAAGHDQGFIIFKIERERPVTTQISNDLMLHPSPDKMLCLRSLTDPNKVIVLSDIEMPGRSVLHNYPKQIYYNRFNSQFHEVLLISDSKVIAQRSEETHCAILYQFKTNWSSVSEAGGLRIPCKGAVFVSNNRICMLETNSTRLYLMSTGGIAQSKFDRQPVDWQGMDSFEITQIFPWNKMGKVILKVQDKAYLLDIPARKIIAQLLVDDFKRTIEGPNCVCLLGSKSAVFVNRQFQEISKLVESEKIKSGIFDDLGIFIYSTPTHVKYCLLNPSGSHKAQDFTIGVLQTVNTILYLINRSGSTIRYIGRDGSLSTLEANLAEMMAKNALKTGNVQTVIDILKSGQIRGFAITNYLREMGYAELALQFEHDPHKKFNLALESGNIDVAMQVARQLKEKSCFAALAEKALFMGKLQIAQQCYQLIRECNKLSFLYNVGGSYSKLNKMPQVSEKLGNTAALFNDSLITGNVRNRIQILANCGQLPLALLLAKTHGQADIAAQIQDLIEQKKAEGVPYSDQVSQIQQNFNQAKAFVPLRPIYLRDSPFDAQPDWPMKITNRKITPHQELGMDQNRGAFGAQSQTGGGQDLNNLLSSISTSEPEKAESSKQEWGGDEDLDLDIPGTEQGGAWGGDGDLDILETGEEEQKQRVSEIYVPPTKGMDKLAQRVMKSEFAADHCIVWNFKKALSLLKEQVGLMNPKPLKQVMLTIATKSRLRLSLLSHTPSTSLNLQDSEGKLFSIVNADYLRGLIEIGYDKTRTGKFQEALAAFQSCIQYYLFVKPSSKEEVEELQMIREICVEYIMAMRMKLEAKKHEKTAPPRSLELICYMTFCRLRPEHMKLTYTEAMKAANNSKNFIHAAYFCRKLIDLPAGVVDNPMVEKYKKYYIQFSKLKSNAVDINLPSEMLDQTAETTANGTFDPSSLTLAPRSSSSLLSSVAHAVYPKSEEGKICAICQLTRIGDISRYPGLPGFK